MAIKGLLEISKVTFTKHIQGEYDSKSGKFKQSDDNWIIETDGVALKKILTFPKVDHTCTISNDCLEIRDVLGIEAAR
jgi:DNA-directed RNA polymerase II subunit RPB1